MAAPVWATKGALHSFDGSGKLVTEPLPEFISMSPDAANTLGQRHYLAGDFARAEECFLATVKADPTHAFGWGNLGLIWQHTGFLDDAMKCLLNSHLLKPDNAQNLTNLGYLHDELGYFDHAMRFFRRALEVEPGQPRATSNLAHSHLKRFEFEEGWRLTDARFNTVPKQAVMREYAHMKLWDGTPCRKLAVWREQGIGDQILYGTLLPELIGRGQDFVCELDDRLIPAFQRSFPTGAFVGKGHVTGFADCDAHVPMMSLARYFRPSLESFIAQPKRLLRAFSAAPRIPDTGKIVAISWRSFHPPINMMQERRKSAPLLAFGLLGQRDDVQLVSVQYGAEKLDQDFEAWNATANNPIYVPPIDLHDDIEGVLATIAACDCVVTTSQVTAHFAGALGKETYLISLRGTPTFFYWQPNERGRSLWYNSVQIVSGPDVLTWDEAIRRVNEMI